MTDTTIVGAIRSYLAGYSQLATGALLLINDLGSFSIGYSIEPQPGDRILEEDIVGNTVRVFPFAFTSMESTDDQLAIIQTSGFYEGLAHWLDTQTKANQLPTLNAGQTPTKIEARSWAFLYQEGESGKGIYQIQCALTYDQVAV